MTSTADLRDLTQLPGSTKISSASAARCLEKGTDEWTCDVGTGDGRESYRRYRHADVGLTYDGSSAVMADWDDRLLTVYLADMGGKDFHETWTTPIRLCSAGSSSKLFDRESAKAGRLGSLHASAVDNARSMAIEFRSMDDCAQNPIYLIHLPGSRVLQSERTIKADGVTHSAYCSRFALKSGTGDGKKATAFVNARL